VNFFFRVVIPKETSKEKPFEEKLKITYGVIRSVQIEILPGHAGLAGLQVFFHECQVYPLNRGGFYLGDNLSVKFEDNYLINIEPYQLKVSGYNNDIRYSHAFLLSFGIMREISDKTGEESDYRTFIGEEGE